MYPQDSIFEEFELLGSLSKKKEKLALDALYSYIVEIFSNDPHPRDVTECCKAMLQLFPYLTTTPSAIEGIVRLSKKSHSKIEGYAYHCLYLLLLGFALQLSDEERRDFSQIEEQ